MSNFKHQISSTKFQTGSLRTVGKAIVFLFGILNLGHAQRRRLCRVLKFICFLAIEILRLLFFMPGL